MCKGQDPIEVLSKGIENENLHAELAEEFSRENDNTIITNNKSKTKL